MKVLLPYAMVALAAALLAWQGTRTCESRKLAEERRLRNNAEAVADTLRLVVASDSNALRVYERKVQTAKNESDLSKLERDEERKARAKAELKLQAVYDVALAYRAQLEGMSLVVAAGDSTHIPINLWDRTVTATGEVAFPGRIVPDPQPAARTVLEIAIPVLPVRVRAVLDPKRCLPSVDVTTTDPHVSVVKLEGAILDGFACPGDARKRFPWGAVAGGIAGLLLGVLAGP